MTYHAVVMAEQTLGSAEAIEMLEDIILNMRENNVPAPKPMLSTEAH